MTKLKKKQTIKDNVELFCILHNCKTPKVLQFSCNGFFIVLTQNDCAQIKFY